MNFTPTFKKTISNLTWLSFDRVIRLFGAIFVNVFLTRYLGPEKNGILNYSIAFAGIFAPLAILGMDAVVIRDITRNKSDKNEILGTAFRLRIIGSLISLILAFIGIVLMKPNDVQIQLIVLITSIGLIFQAFDVIDYWFQSQVLSKFTVYAKNSAFIILAVCKITAIFLSSALIVFVILSTIEFILAAFFLFLIYRKTGNYFSEWKFSTQRAKQLLQNSWPIFISDLAMFAQIRIDQIMIGNFLSNKDVGLYAAAQRLSEPLGFIPMIIMSSVYPIFLAIKDRSEEEFFSKMTNLYRLMTIISIITCLSISLLSNQIVQILYGEKFIYSGTILAFLIWGRFYTNLGVARSIFISSENLFRHTLKCSIAGISVNLILNYFLIQSLGVMGAIYSMFISFFVTIFLIDAITPETRRNFKSMLTGITTFYKFKTN